MSELRRKLEDLADQRGGEPRGADRVFAAATGTTTTTRRPPLLVGGAIAAAVLAIAGLATIVNRGGGTDALDTAGSAGTNPGEVVAVSTTTPTPTTGPPTATTTLPAAATTLPTTPKAVLAAARLQRFSSCGDYVGTAKAKAVQLAGPYGVPGLSNQYFARGEAVDGAAPPGDPSSAPAMPATGGQGGGDTPDFSTTNVQEAGVDEPDTVKTDGRRILALAQGKLWYVAVDGTTPRVAGTLALDGVWGNELLLAGDRAIVVQTQMVYPMGAGRPEPGGGVAIDVMYPPSYSQKSTLAIVDVSTPAMKVIKTLTVDGAYVSARMIDGIARIVVRSSPQGFEWRYPTEPGPAAEAQATEQNREVVRRSTDGNWLPSLAVSGPGGQADGTTTRPLVACDAAMHPQSFAGFGMLTVLTVDPAKPEGADSVTVQADGEQVYASRGSLYVATTAWDRTVPSPDGGPSGVIQVPETLIHKFAIDDPGRARYLVSGRVRGTALNQFSFSEDGGRLRVATTDFGTNGSDGESFVSVFADDNRSLVQIGQVGGLGKGERIFAVRFVGNVGYVVTFRQVDPLYVVDLADPTKPRVAGELKILGYSAYLHPIGDGLLLGVGQDASEEGRTQGTQVSVFDVSDPAHPALLHKVKLGQGSSNAEFDHHAFLWWAKTGLAVIPFASYDQSTGNPTFNGAVGFSAARSGLGEKGRVQHPADPQYGNAPPPIDRSLVVGDTLFTISQTGVLSSALADLSPRTFARFG